MPHSVQMLITALRGVVLQMGVDLKHYQKNVNWNGCVQVLELNFRLS